VKRDDSVEYATVPICRSWLIPLWDGADRDELDDLIHSLRYKGPDRFNDALQAFQHALADSATVGVRLYVGQKLPSRVTLPLAPDTPQQATEILTIANKSIVESRGVAPWQSMKADLKAICECVATAEDGETISFGFSAIVPAQYGYTEASTDWIS